MTAGLQVFNSNGVLDMDSSTVIGRLLTIVDTTAISGSVTIPGVQSGDQLFGVPLNGWNGTPAESVSVMAAAPYLVFNGSTMSWTRDSSLSGYTINTCYTIVGVR